MYNQLYELLNHHIYNIEGLINTNPAQDLTLTILATLGSLLVVGLPFFVIYAIVRRFL